MNLLIDLHYCGNIEYFTLINTAEKVVIEVNENFKKQTFRNRAEIYGANGRLNLSVPIKKRGLKCPSKHVKIHNVEDWKHLHFRSLESAYRSSPYFEFYEHHFEEIYTRDYHNLVDLNKTIFEKVIELLKLEIDFSYSPSYAEDIQDFEDYRDRVLPKTSKDKNIPAQPYIQVFENKFGFIPNLSILDLLFNEGPNAVSYLS